MYKILEMDREELEALFASVCNTLYMDRGMVASRRHSLRSCLLKVGKLLLSSEKLAPT